MTMPAEPTSPTPYQKRARQYAQLLGLPARMNNTAVYLTEYPNQDTLTFLQPGTTLQEHQQLTAAFAEEITGRGARVSFVTLHIQDYHEWLARFGLQDEPANRAQYVSWKSAADPKPIPVAPTAPAPAPLP